MAQRTINAPHSFKDGEVLIDVSEDADLSSRLELGGYKLGAMHIPDTFTSTTVQFRTDDSDPDGPTLTTVYDDNNAVVEITVAAGRTYVFDNYAPVLSGLNGLYVATGSAEIADRTIRFSLKA